MAKKSFKVKCLNVQANSQRSGVNFAVDAKAAVTEPGKPAQITARTVISFNFSGSDLKNVNGFEPGNDYTITVEG